MVLCPYFQVWGFLVVDQMMSVTGPNGSIHNRKLRTPENPEPGKQGEEPQRLPEFGHVFGLVSSGRYPGDFGPRRNDADGEQDAEVHAEDTTDSPDNPLVHPEVFPPVPPGRHVVSLAGSKMLPILEREICLPATALGMAPTMLPMPKPLSLQPAQGKNVAQAPGPGISGKAS